MIKASFACRSFFATLTFGLSFLLIGTHYGCTEPNHLYVSIPKPPDESLQVSFRYPDKPVMLNRQSYEQALNQLASQTTLLVLQAPDRPLSPEDLHILRNLQQKYYRYGVFVLLIDLNEPARWPELKQTLEASNANFPAAYLIDNTGKNEFLSTASVSKNQIQIINHKQKQNSIIHPPFDERRLNNLIKQILSQ